MAPQGKRIRNDHTQSEVFSWRAFFLWLLSIIAVVISLAVPIVQWCIPALTIWGQSLLMAALIVESISLGVKGWQYTQDCRYLGESKKWGIRAELFFSIGKALAITGALVLALAVSTCLTAWIVIGILGSQVLANIAKALYCGWQWHVKKREGHADRKECLFHLGKAVLLGCAVAGATVVFVGMPWIVSIVALGLVVTAMTAMALWEVRMGWKQIASGSLPLEDEINVAVMDKNHTKTTYGNVLGEIKCNERHKRLEDCHGQTSDSVVTNGHLDLGEQGEKTNPLKRQKNNRRKSNRGQYKKQYNLDAKKSESIADVLFAGEKSNWYRNCI